jgi:hypothetical protein
MSNEIIASEKNQGFMNVSTIENAIKVSEYIAASSFCPVSLKGKPGDILVCLQMGQELGLKPMQAMQNIAVINGRPSLWGDAMIAVCRQSPDFESIKEMLDIDTMTATCVVCRKGEPEFTSSFSQADAKTANLWGKAGPWTNYPKRMLQMRARGFALRDAFPDLLRGIIIKEEAEDYEDLPSPERTVYSRAPITIDNQSDQLINEEQLSDLQLLVDELEGDLKKTCKHLNIESVEKINITQWNELIRQFKKKVNEKRKLESLPINMHVQESMSEQAKEFFGDESE